MRKCLVSPVRPIFSVAVWMDVAEGSRMRAWVQQIMRGGRQERVSEIAAELNQLVEQCVIDLKNKWLGYCQVLVFKDEVPLSDRIDGFAYPVQEFVRSKYPVLLSDGGSMFWMMVFTAVIESGTHPIEEVSAATKALEKKYKRI